MGAPGIGLAIASSVAPLTVVAGVVTTGLAVTGLTAVSAAMIAVAAALVIFAVGYMAMARHITNTGAFYAYVSKGLGRPLGVGSSWIALLAYNCFQIASYGGLGAISEPLFQDWFGVDVPWWVFALVVWAIVAFLGRRDVSVSEKVLAVLVISETALVVVYSLIILFSSDYGFSAKPFSAGQLFGAGGGALLAIGATSFAGVEQGAVYIEESKDPLRSVPRATYYTIGFIAVLYAVASWVQISAAGDQAVARAGEEGPDLFFNEAAATVGGWALDLGHILFLTSLIAAMIAFHNIIARYTYALGREGVLPKLFGQTVGGAPRAASTAQSVLGLVVIGIYAVTGLDPLVELFFVGGTTGGVGVLLLITLTSASVIGFFLRAAHGETAWRRLGAPVIATLLLIGISYLAVTNLATLYGVDPGTGPALYMPIVAVVVLVAGIAWGLILRHTRPDVYQGIGLGPRSAVATTGGFAAMMAGGSGPATEQPQGNR
nr:APC family permease [Mangrovihabitans endophyticus]